MSKYGFNEKELRKTIVTKIDKDGFHERTITYGKDSGDTEDMSMSGTYLIHRDKNTTVNGYMVSLIAAYFPKETYRLCVSAAMSESDRGYNIGDVINETEIGTGSIQYFEDISDFNNKIAVIDLAYSAYGKWYIYAIDSNHAVIDYCFVYAPNPIQ